MIIPHRARIRLSSQDTTDARTDLNARIRNQTPLGNLGRIIMELMGELRRLNHAGFGPTMLRSRSRRESARLIKAALAERYREHNRCC
jgi:hypothetical protein